MSDMKCSNLQTNLDNCPCTAEDCPRRGTCCECLRAHLSSNSLPACVRDRAQMIEG
jgi:hypothetical protein